MKQSTFQHSDVNLYGAVKKAALSMDLEIKKESPLDGKISLYYSGGFLSYGNRISVEIVSTESSNSILIVSSKSASSIQIIDWGTNSDLENDIITTVKNILG